MIKDIFFKEAVVPVNQLSLFGNLLTKLKCRIYFPLLQLVYDTSMSTVKICDLQDVV